MSNFKSEIDKVDDENFFRWILGAIIVSYQTERKKLFSFLFYGLMAIVLRYADLEMSNVLFLGAGLFFWSLLLEYELVHKFKNPKRFIMFQGLIYALVICLFKVIAESFAWSIVFYSIAVWLCFCICFYLWFEE